ncbi:type I polyketide synthase [Streptomyces sp. NPDC051572]|uniref:type I polyketide synthase n=1 Tax=Streptomyces sp. NPDC051572 TaxID=3155802 RepID=UPI00344B7582
MEYREALERVLTAVAARLEADPDRLDPRARFSELGLDSAAAIAMVAEVASASGSSLAPTAAWDHPTAEDLARHVSGQRNVVEALASTTEGAEARTEPIAVVGMACRLPGAPDVDAYWRLLIEGRDAVTEVPADRWNASALYHPDHAEPGRATTRWGGYIDGVDRFDPQFFGLSPREAVDMDPQQRLMLELAWTALEDYGTDPSALRGSRTGVFAAALWNDYARLSGRDLHAIRQHTATGEDLSIISARICHTLGLRGPGIGITTACSGALVAVHLACQSLRDGDSELALAGGVNLLLAPESTVAMTKFGAMSPRGRCRAFDAGADGYVRAEGGGLVVLKRLSRARADGDRVYCVIRGSAVNNDGYSNGLTAPSPQAQEDMIRQACARARVDPGRIQYVEAHGTGTALGDPIEAGALGRVLGAGRPADKPLLIGSAKTNLGHLESAAGIAGLIKTSLALYHRALPPSLHFERPTPHADFAALGLAVVTEARPWPQDPDVGAPALAGVSSFGFGGTNCHVVLEGPTPPAQLLTLSAPDPDSLSFLADELVQDVHTAAPDTPTADFVLAANRRSVPGSSRTAAVVHTRADLIGALELSGRRTATKGSPPAPPRTAFVFSGQGSQWAGMGRELLGDEPVFCAAVEDCDHVFAELAGWSVLKALRTADPAKLNRTEVLQPLVFTVQVGLTALWDSWGVRPDVVVGHSLGEVAAAHAAGILGLRDAARVVHHRSRLMARIDGAGAVAVVALDERRTAEVLARHGAGRVHRAGQNSPLSTVIAGDPQDLDACLDELRRQDVECHRVAMGVAAHTPHCDPLLPELGASLAGIRPRPARMPMISTVTGTPVHGSLDGSYWQRNLREPVRFASAMSRLLSEGPAAVLEIGPHPVLSRPLSEAARAYGPDAADAPVLASLHRAKAARTALLESAGRLHALGWDVHPDPDAGGHREGPRLLVLSAHSPEAVRAQAGEVANLLNDDRHTTLDALCSTTARVRSGHRHRLAVVARDQEEATELLRRAAAGASSPQIRKGAAARRPRGLAFVFTGQGTLWAGVGSGLMRREPVFRQALERHDEVVRELAGWSLMEELRATGERSRLGCTHIAQPTLCALQLALAELWEHWEVRPNAVVGHSVGEIAAACVAGALPADDALRIAVERGRVMERAAGQGRMASVALPEAEVVAALDAWSELEQTSWRDRLGVAAVNAPSATVIAGDPRAMERFLAAPPLRGARIGRLPVDYAFHSPQMDPFRTELAERLQGVRPGATRVPLVSTVTGRETEGAALGADHWGRTVRDTVRFAEAVAALAGLGCSDFLEVGPHPALGSATAQCLEGEDVGDTDRIIVPTLRRGDDTLTPLVSRGALWAGGHPAKSVVPAAPVGRPVRLPAYPWQRERYWIEEAPLGQRVAAPRAAGRVSELLCSGQVEELTESITSRHTLSESEHLLLPRLLRLLAAEDTPVEVFDGGDETPRYVTRWEPVAPPQAPGTERFTGHWLLVGGGPLTDALAERLRAVGDTVTVVPGSGDGLSTALDAAVEAPAPFLGAVHLLGAEWSYKDRAADVGEALRLITASALVTTQCLAARALPPRARLWLITRDAHGDTPAARAVGASGLHQGALVRQLAGAALWGFGATVSQEHSGLWGGLIDTDDTEPSAVADAIADVLHRTDGEDRLAVRDGSVHTARLSRLPVPRAVPPTPALDPAAVYLVSGGLGGVGLLLARRLADRGARRLVLVGRTAPSAAVRVVLDGLEDRGVRTTVVQADVSRREDVVRIVDGIRAEGTRLRGVVHAAGVLDDGVVLQQDPERLQRVLAPKALGAWHLHEATIGLPLDFFVLCSSFTAAVGSAGQSGYSAANAVLDALAVARRAAGAPAVSVGWGPWRDTGMTAGDAAARQRWREQGLTPLDPDACLLVFDRAVAGATGPREMVLDADWRTYCDSRHHSAVRPYLDSVCGTDRSTGSLEERELTALLADAHSDDLPALIGDHVARRVAEMLGFAESARIDRETGLFDLGMDSMTAVALAQRLGRDVGGTIALPSTAVFDHPTVAALAAHVTERLRVPADTDRPELALLLDEIETLSEEEAARRLADLPDNGPYLEWRKA